MTPPSPGVPAWDPSEDCCVEEPTTSTTTAPPDTTTSTTTAPPETTTTTTAPPTDCCLWYLESNWICDESPHWATFVVFKIFGPVPCGANSPWPESGNSTNLAYYHPLCDDTPENRAIIAAAAGVPSYEGDCG